MTAGVWILFGADPSRLRHYAIVETEQYRPDGSTGAGEEYVMALLLHLRLRDFIRAEDDPDKENNGKLDGWATPQL